MGLSGRPLLERGKGIVIKLLHHPSQHAKELERIYRRAYKEHPEYADTEGGKIRRYLHWLWSRCPEGFWVAEKDGNMLGFIVADERWRTGDGETIGEIHEMAVDYCYQGTGIGSALLEAAMNYFQEKGLKVVGLWVGEHNWPARRFYTQHGFKEYQREGKWRRMLFLTGNEK